MIGYFLERGRRGFGEAYEQEDCNYQDDQGDHKGP